MEEPGRLIGDDFFEDLIAGIRQGRLRFVGRESAGIRSDGTPLVKMMFETEE